MSATPTQLGPRIIDFERMAGELERVRAELAATRTTLGTSEFARKRAEFIGLANTVLFLLLAAWIIIGS